MDLDLLKKNWKEIDFAIEQKVKPVIQEFKGQKSIFTAKTITKKLFRFSIIEFSIWGVAAIWLQYYFQELTPQSFMEFEPLIYIEKLNIIILFVFLALFLWSFNTINTVNNIKFLITKILRTKNVVKSYITYNLFIFNLTFLVSFIWELKHNKEIGVILQNETSLTFAVLMAIGAIVSILFTFFIYKAYYFFYGNFILNFNQIAQNLKHLNSWEFNSVDDIRHSKFN